MGGFKTCYFGLLRPQEINTFQTSFKQVEFVECVNAIVVASGGGILGNPEHLSSKHSQHYFIFCEHFIGGGSTLQCVTVR